jgi:hypothetical protein
MLCGHPDSAPASGKEGIVRSQNKKTWLAILLAGGILAAPAAFANTIQFDFSPTGTPAMTALFEDAGPNQLKLTISAGALSDGNSINSVYFNFNPGFDSKNLTFAQIGSTGDVQGLANSANDSYKAIGGGGKFDINLAFGPKFTAGDAVTFLITCPYDFSIDDFLFLETAAAGRSPIYAAGSIQEKNGVVIVQGTPTAENVPDAASTLGLLALGLLSIGFFSRRLRIVEPA